MKIMMGPPPNNNVNDQYKIPKPKKFKDVPKYLGKIIASFFKRMFYIIKLVWEASPIVLFALTFMAIFDGVIPLVTSLIGKELLNSLSDAYNNNLTDFQIIIWILIAQCAASTISTVLYRMNSIIVRISGELVSNHIKLKIMMKAKELDVASFDSPEFYAKMENASREASMRPIQVLNSTFSVFTALITIISYLFVITVIGIGPAMLVAAVSIPSTVINFVFRKKNHDYMFRRSKDRRQMNYYSEVVVNKDMVKEVRTLGLADEFTQRYKNVFKHYFKGLKKLMLAEMWWSIGSTALSSAVNCILFVMIAQRVFKGEYNVGDYNLYIDALGRISSGIATLVTTSASVYEGTIFINNLITFLDEKRKIVPSVDPPRPVERGKAHEIVFENVSFRYPGVDRDIIKRVNLKISAGESVVIVGLNGAGKTTLIKLLMRLYDPTEGRILLDGHDIREYQPEELYKLFGIVFQDYGKYAVSVKDNIKFGALHKEADEEKIKQAAEDSNAGDFIDKLPNKFDTPLMRVFEDNGIELSIGQWQKLAIARAFYSDSEILILDEPTASLDPMAEQEIFNQFDELRGSKTSIFVSHRLSSATTADSIIVIKDGQITERGNHEELMRAHGEYYTLFSTQAKRYMYKEDGEDMPEEGAEFPPEPGRPVPPPENNRGNI